MLSNKNQFSTPCLDMILKKTSNTQNKQFLKNSEQITENFKIKSIPLKSQPTEIKIRRIANKIEGNWENKNQATLNAGFKTKFKEKVRSASPEYQNSIESDENIKTNRVRKDGARILLAEKYKELEEIWKSHNIHNKKTIELCFEIIFCLNKYSPKI